MLLKRIQIFLRLFGSKNLIALTVIFLLGVVPVSSALVDQMSRPQQMSFETLVERLGKIPVANARLLAVRDNPPQLRADVAGQPVYTNLPPTPADVTAIRHEFRDAKVPLLIVNDKSQYIFEGGSLGAAIAISLGLALLAFLALEFAFGYSNIIEVSRRNWRRIVNVNGAGLEQLTNDSADLGRISLDDVRGIDEIKDEVWKYVDFLKHPEKYRRLGARPPRGLVLCGSPGVGKTMLARAIAAEAGVAFLARTGNSFGSMWVSVGPAKVHALFKEARQKKRAIIFIDEIDSVASARTTARAPGDKEDNRLVNAFLTEMDGLHRDEDSQILVIGATNRVDDLDPAFLRPGRLDQVLHVPLPSLKGREDILRLYAARVQLDAGVDLSAVAKNLPGFSGAMIENLINEAALEAVRENADLVTQRHIEICRERVLVGPTRECMLGDDERNRTAIHEMGHAVAALASSRKLFHVEAVSIQPRGQSLGITLYTPTRERYLRTMGDLREEIIILLAGRAAEELLLGDVSDGAANDLERSLSLADAMVTKFGMGSETGLLVAASNCGRSAVAKEEPSWDRSVAADIRAILNECYDEARHRVATHETFVSGVARQLVERLSLPREDILAAWDAQGGKRLTSV